MGWLANAFAVSAVDWLLKAKATNFGISELLHRFLFGIVFGCHVSWSACPSVKFLPYFCINVVIFNVFSADMRTVFLRGRGGSVLKLWINVDKALKRNCWFKKTKTGSACLFLFFFLVPSQKWLMSLCMSLSLTNINTSSLFLPSFSSCLCQHQLSRRINLSLSFLSYFPSSPSAPAVGHSRTGALS